jgi:hypothetical protein
VAFEHRIAAAVVDPGVIDVSTTMCGQIPHFLARMIDAGEQEKFDKDMELALRFSPLDRSMMAFPDAPVRCYVGLSVFRRGPRVRADR